MILLGPCTAYGVGDHVPLAWIFAENNMSVHEALGIGKWKRTPKLRLENAEDGGVGSNAEGERENDDEREAGIFAKDAPGVAKVAQQSFDRGQAFAIAPGLLGLFEAAEFDQGLAAGFNRRHSGPKVVFDVKLEMAFHFCGEFALAAVLAKEAGDSNEQRA